MDFVISKLENDDKRQETWILAKWLLSRHLFQLLFNVRSLREGVLNFGNDLDSREDFLQFQHQLQLRNLEIGRFGAGAGAIDID
ncbi:unnamed protein product [Caenorhabditis angaria]|uniref:Uncharacterized protein n=1 Tax=Caenorhabditis angaria TaxID=860376 RepID=A0A9P1N5K0_9PELO|nr:unnamed protein product [Caenorhabditis angaria]